MKIIGKRLLKRAEKFSSEWNNTGYIVIEDTNKLNATVWNMWKWEKGTSDERSIVASVDGRTGWQIKSEFTDKYKFPDGYNLNP